MSTIKRIQRIDLDADIMCAIAEYQGVLTASALSEYLGGIPHQDAEIAIKRFANIYKCSDRMGNDGRIVYKFKYPLVFKQKPTDIEPEVTPKKIALLTFKWFFLICSLLLLIAAVASFIYLAIVFFILLFVIALFLLGAGSDNRNNLVIVVNNNNTIIHNHYYSSESGFVEAKPERQPLTVKYTLSFLFRDGAHGQAFYKKMAAFGFGPNLFPDNRFRYMNELKKFSDCVVINKGIITAADWVKYSGQSLEEAENLIQKYARTYDASYVTSPEGVRIYSFPFYYTNHDLDRYEQTPIWEERYIPTFIGNSWKANLSILLLVSFSTTIFYNSLDENVFYYLPFFYGVSLLLGPFIRLPFFIQKLNKAKQENIRREGLQRIWQYILNGTQEGVDLERYNGKQLAIEYHGQINTEEGVEVNDEVGFAPFYQFPLIQKELVYSELIREKSPDDIEWKPINEDIKQSELREFDEYVDDNL